MRGIRITLFGACALTVVLFGCATSEKDPTSVESTTPRATTKSTVQTDEEMCNNYARERGNAEGGYESAYRACMIDRHREPTILK
jgi:hypothetical protein